MPSWTQNMNQREFEPMEPGGLACGAKVSSVREITVLMLGVFVSDT